MAGCSFKILVDFRRHLGQGDFRRLELECSFFLDAQSVRFLAGEIERVIARGIRGGIVLRKPWLSRRASPRKWSRSGRASRPESRWIRLRAMSTWSSRG